MTTLRQITANRQNAHKSTGPSTEEGKQRSRENALKHGLAGNGAVLAQRETERVRQRLESWRETYQPATDAEEWAYRQLVVSSVRIDLCQNHEITMRGYFARRASGCWDTDRRLAVEEQAVRLSKAPAQVAARLRRSSRGCDWLLQRWRALQQIVGEGRAWTDSQRSLALDMLGKPLDLRDAFASLGAEANTAEAKAVAAREIAELEQIKSAVLDDLDLDERAAAESGAEIETPRPLALLRRYEAACMRRYLWAREQLFGQVPEETQEPDSSTAQCQAAGEPPPNRPPHEESPAKAAVPRLKPRPAPIELEPAPAPVPLGAVTPASVSITMKGSPFRLTDAMLEELPPLNRRERRALAKLRRNR
jgi:hypothetical protein